MFFVTQPLVISAELGPLMASLGDRMNQLLKAGVSDLLELGHSVTSENLESLHRSLMFAAREEQERQQVLLESADHRLWRCVSHRADRRPGSGRRDSFSPW